MRPHTTGIIILLALAALAGTASAQSEIPGHVRNRMLGWSTLAGGAALAVSAGGAALAGAAASDGCAADDWCVISDKVVVGFSVGISMAAIAVPLASAYALHLTGTKHGRTKTGFGVTYVTSLSSFLLTGTLSFAAISALADSQLSRAGVGTLTAGLIGATLFSTAGFGYLAYRRRDRRDARRVDATLLPSFSTRAAALTWSLRY